MAISWQDYLTQVFQKNPKLQFTPDVRDQVVSQYKQLTGIDPYAPIAKTDLQGTMSGGTVSPNAAPTIQQSQSQSNPQPQAPIGQPKPVTSPSSGSQIPTTNNQQYSPFAFAQVIDAMKQKLATNQNLIDQKNLMIMHLYDKPLTDEQKLMLSPEIRDALESGDKSRIDTQLRLINDQIQGRTNTLNQSMDYLVNGYQDQLTYNQNERDKALSTIQSFVTQYGSNAPAALKSLFGQGYLDQLKAQGIDINAFSALPTVNQTRYQSEYGGGLGTISIPSGTIASQYNNPGNLRNPDGSWQQFSTPDQGFQALVSDLQAKMSGQSSHPIPDGPDAGKPLTPTSTLEDLIRVYAPTTDGNDPVGYAQSVADALGVSPTTPLSQIDPQELAIQMAQHESGTTVQLGNVATVAQGIIDGTIPPPAITSRPTQYMLQLEAELQKRGFNLKNATLDWTATQKWLSSANSTTQLRLRQAIGSVTQAIQGLRQNANDWNAGGFAPLNALNLKAALTGAYGQKAQQIAANFQQQATIIQDELGQTFMGGNSPTDKALGLAGQVFDTSWSNQTLQAALDQLDTNLGYRLNAIENTGAVLPSDTTGTQSNQDLLNSIPGL